jgi:hypothetical protein
MSIMVDREDGIYEILDLDLEQNHMLFRKKIKC